jgi:glycosyltransferase involved in cell wall biosynthesis
MRILHIWDGDYPWDVRVEKINDTLLENGHEVVLVCRNLARKQLVEEHRGITIYRLPILGGGNEYLNGMLSFPFFFNPIWKQHTLDIAKKTKAELIIVRDLPLALMGINVGKIMGIPVIMDMAENYPCMLEAMIQCDKGNILNYLIRNPYLAKLVEKRVFNDIDGVMVVIDESRDRLISLGVDPKKITIINNTPPSNTIYSHEVLDKPIDDIFHNPDNLILLYNGLTNPARGILDFVSTMPKILEKHPNVKLVINGKGKHDNQIYKVVKTLNLEKSVYHKGWVSYEDKLKYLYHCDVGLIPYFITSHWNTTIPNKIFDYMAMKKPVLSSNIIPTARIMKETGSGLVYDRNNVHDLCDKIGQLMDKNNRQTFGENGYQAIINQYNWDNDKKYIINTINKFA